MLNLKHKHIWLLLCWLLYAPVLHAAQKPVLRVGVLADSPPVSFMAEKKTIRGLAVDLASLVGAALHHEVRFRQGSASALREMLLKGEIEIICGMPEQQLLTDGLSVQPTPFALNRHILVAAPDTHITCEQDYPGQRLAVLRSDPYANIIKAFNGQTILVDSYHEGLNVIQAGQADAFIAQSGEIASYIAQRSKFDSIKIMGLSLERVPLDLITLPEKRDLLQHVNSALHRLETSGKLDLLRDKWLGRNLGSQGFFEQYGKVIFYVSLSGLVLFLAVIIWVFTLRQQVARVTRKLSSSEHRYRELIEASPDIILLLEQDGSIQFANRIARETLFADAEELPGCLMQTLCINGRCSLEKLLEAAALTGQIVHEEVILNENSDYEQFIEFIAVRHAGYEGNPLFCCIGHDLTKRRKMEQELMQMDRLAILGKLAAGVAHEINNPLGIIMTHTDVALESAADPELHKHLLAIQRNVERAAATTRRLLDNSTARPVNMESQDMTDILLESLNFLRPRLKNIIIITDELAPSLPLCGDRLLLEQLCINLLLNASESMGENGKLIIRGNILPGQKGEILRVEVEDSGRGIMRENLERIFEIFFTTNRKSGFGLGLFISRQIATGHGGRLYADSEYGRGARMILELPARACMLIQ